MSVKYRKSDAASPIRGNAAAACAKTVHLLRCNQNNLLFLKEKKQAGTNSAFG
jgi:hypothetical protein